MLTYADWRMLTYDDVCGRMRLNAAIAGARCPEDTVFGVLTYADVC
jgi:hypothetical protein